MNDTISSPADTDNSQPASPGRRSMLLGLGVAGSTALVGALSPARAQTAPDLADPHAGDVLPWLGARQAGVTTPRQVMGLVVSFNVLATTAADLERLFRTLTERIAFLTQGGAPPVIDRKFPPSDSGLMGPVVMPDNLTVTLAVGASLFDKRFGLESRKPTQLRPMPKFPNDAPQAELCHGDLLVQICSNTTDCNLHALRDIIKHTPDLLMVRWKQEGFAPPPRSAGESGASPRNLMGFKDGTANPDTNDTASMNRLIWVQPDANEPAWARNGSYMVVRIIRNFVERWDRTPLQEQEAIFGRDRASGAPLAMKSEFDTPSYHDDPEGKRTPLNSHIRLANPRTPQSERNIILRRPFNYSNGVTKSGQLDMGLLFICFQSNLEAGFVTVQKRLDGEPLEEYIKPVGGGYFFVLPGITDKNQFIGQSLLASPA